MPAARARRRVLGLLDRSLTAIVVAVVVFAVVGRVQGWKLVGMTEASAGIDAGDLLVMHPIDLGFSVGDLVLVNDQGSLALTEVRRPPSAVTGSVYVATVGAAPGATETLMRPSQLAGIVAWRIHRAGWAMLLLAPPIGPPLLVGLPLLNLLWSERLRLRRVLLRAA